MCVIIRDMTQTCAHVWCYDLSTQPETRDKRQETRDKRQEARDKKQSVYETRVDQEREIKEEC